MKIKVIVGTASDNAWYVARAVEAALAGPAVTVEVLLADAATRGEVLEPAPGEAVLICTSTQGSGELPENLRPLFIDLAERPRYLGALRYGVIALGDSFYGDTFAMGGRQFDLCLQDLGAERIGQTLVLDASDGGDGEAQAAVWALEWLEALQAGSPA